MQIKIEIVFFSFKASLLFIFSVKSSRAIEWVKIKKGGHVSVETESVTVSFFTSKFKITESTGLFFNTLTQI